MLQNDHSYASHQNRGDQSDLSQMLGLLRTLDAKVEDLRSIMTRRRKEHLTVEEGGEAVGRSAYTVRRWVTERKIRAIRVEGTGPRGRLIIPRTELDRLIQSGEGGSIPDAAVD